MVGVRREWSKCCTYHVPGSGTNQLSLGQALRSRLWPIKKLPQVLQLDSFSQEWNSVNLFLFPHVAGHS
jgi:hypothetical protein